jgi:hypothetical protein
LEAQKVKFKARKVFGKAWKVDLETFPKTFMTFWTVAEGFPALLAASASPIGDAGLPPTPGSQLDLQQFGSACLTLTRPWTSLQNQSIRAEC